MEEKEEKGKEEKSNSHGMGEKVKGFFTDDIKDELKDVKDELTKGVKRAFAVLLIVAVGWIIFVSLHSFLWSTSYTFYQNIVITFDSIIIAIVIGIALIYKVSGMGKITKKLSSMTKKFISKEDTS